MRCKFCKGLTVTNLRLPTRQEIEKSYARKWSFNDNSDYDEPAPHYYRHQPCLGDLIHSADKGCEICQMFLQSFQRKRPSLFGNSGEDECDDDSGSESLDTNTADMQSDAPFPLDSNAFSERIYVTAFYKGATFSWHPWVNKIAVMVGGDDAPAIKVFFDLFVSHDDPYADRTFILGRSVARNPLSNESLRLIKGYISDCKNRHIKCSLARSTPLPTRLVNVGDSNTAPFISHTSRDHSGSYVALSYCWGGVSRHQTTKSNLRQRTKRIDYSALPRTIKDAIKVTKALGYQYIWIDSLCIIQDSTSDWERESKNMATVYGNAQITIHAASAATSNDGFLANRTQKSYPIDWGNGLHTRNPPQAFIREQAQDWLSLTRTSPLATRGWTLQERILSKRSLFFGKDQVYWECITCIRCENDFLAISDGRAHKNYKFSARHSVDYHKRYISLIDNMSDFEKPLYYSRMNKDMPRKGLVDKIQDLKGQIPAGDSQSSLQSMEQKSMLEEWSAIVAEYSGRHLTKSSDKLPAIAGLMLQLNTRYKGKEGKYAAGLWEYHIYDLWGLLWKVDAPWDDIEIMEDLRAPSWSWAKLDGRVNTQIDQGNGKASKYDARVLSVNVDGSYMGNKKGCITIRGYCGYLDQKLFFPTGSSPGRMLAGPEKNHPFARIIPDGGIISREEQLSFNAVCKPYCIRMKELRGQGSFYSSRFLLLAPVPGSHDTYIRIGFGDAPYRAGLMFPDDIYTDESWDRSWHKLKKRTIRLM